jgi:hypothetical protein
MEGDFIEFAKKGTSPFGGDGGKIVLVAASAWFPHWQKNFLPRNLAMQPGGAQAKVVAFFVEL